MDDIVIVLRIGLALVFLAAAVGKLLGDHSLLAFGAATVEAGLAGVLIVGFYPVVVALLTGMVCIAYLGHALITSDDRCQCFGSRLPSTSRAWQRTRNALLVACSAAYFVIVVTVGPSPGLPLMPAIDIGLAVTAALSLITLPWYIDWTFPSQRPLGPRSNP